MFRKKKKSESETLPAGPPVLFQVIPPKSGDFVATDFVNTLEALNVVDEILSLELVTTENQVSMYVRSARPDHIVSALEARYPQARFETVSPEDDPLLLDAEVGAVYRQVFWSGGEEWLPLLVEYEEGGDPFVEVVGGLSAEMPPDARVVTRLVLSEQDRASSEQWRHRALSGSGSANQQLADAERLKEQQSQAAEKSRSGGTQSTQDHELYLIVGGFGVLMYGAALVHAVLTFWTEHRLEVIGFGALGLVALAGVAYVLHKVGLFSGPPEPRYYDPAQVQLRVGGASFRMELQLYVLLPGAGAEREAAERVLRPVVASYRRFDSPLGARFESGPVERLRGFDPRRDDAGFVGLRRDILGRVRIGEGIVGTREVAALWHVPGDAVEAPELLRAGSRRLPVPHAMYQLGDDARVGAALVGVEKYRDGGLRKLHFPAEVMGRHHLYVARTRMGKSTLMQHVARSLLRDIASGVSDASLVVVDPHSDLVTAIMESMPVGAAGDVRLIDMGDRERTCGLNLLDVYTFPQREMTIPTVISIARATSLPNSWGDRMEAILEWTLIAMYEANRQRSADEQYTIYDGLDFLTDESMRQEVIREGGDPEVARWWYRIFPQIVPVSDRRALSPVLRKLGEYAAVESARRVLGQRRSTLDIREAIHSGKTVLVDTARARTGPAVSAIVGASVLKLLHDIIKAQSELPPGDRRRIVVIVDEAQTFPGVEYDDMLAELSKFGGSLILATQSLDRLDDLTESRTMKETILANVGCLVVFQVNSNDAKLLRQELRRDMIDEDDIMGLPPHHCYGRLTLEKSSVYFSTELLPHLSGNPGLADLVRRATSAYTRPTAEVDAEYKKFMQKYRQYLADPDDDTLDFGSDC